jgi:3-hydroxyacyl-[acyl-carrier-protein] dehydratase
MSKVAEERAAAPVTSQALETADLFRLLPHRYPFLMVDRVIEIRGDESCIGIKNVTVNEPFFAGHFPGNPVMPGVLLLEGMAQSAGAVCGLISSKSGKPPAMLLLTIDKAKFRRPVLPGQTIEYHMQKTARRRNMWWFQGRAMVSGELVAEAEVGAMLWES